jgi:hypothetical protein
MNLSLADRLIRGIGPAEFFLSYDVALNRDRRFPRLSGEVSRYHQYSANVAADFFQSPRNLSTHNRLYVREQEDSFVFGDSRIRDK